MFHRCILILMNFEGNLGGTVISLKLPDIHKNNMERSFTIRILIVVIWKCNFEEDRGNLSQNP